MLVWICAALGLISNPERIQAEKRIFLIRGLAVNIAKLAETNRHNSLQNACEAALNDDSAIRSIGIIRKGQTGNSIFVGPHRDFWVADKENDLQEQISVDIHLRGRKWGELQVAFAPFSNSDGQWAIPFPIGPILFIFATSTLLAITILSRTLKYLNPSKVVPNRVRCALDTLTEGLVLVDKSGKIAHANAAFCKIAKLGEKEILGRTLEFLKWRKQDEVEVESPMPWEACFVDHEKVTGKYLALEIADKSPRRFAVNATPIFNGQDSVRGALISFDDVTAIDQKNAELAEMIGSLRSSRDEIARQNERLNFLASFDPLTQCMNRRAFFGEFEKHWENPDNSNLSLIILDVDHFKSVNDTHGHSTGDEVLKSMGNVLRQCVADHGIVCRYGGEEFVVLLPNVTVEEAVDFANDIRIVIEQTEVSNIHFTASFGVSSKAFRPMDPQHLLDQADESLYTAKRGGRNQVVRYDQRSQHQDLEAQAETDTAPAPASPDGEVSYSAVTGLLSALSFRCSDTAEHSIRVADLCVSVGAQLMNRRELYRLEVAALLHDIGKVGVPDSILHKPGPLSPEEWKVINKHDDIGGEIIRNAFGSDEIAHWIESHHICLKRSLCKDDSGSEPNEVPLASRIITVCDAYDAMTNDRVYRTALPVEVALAELEKNCPMQFDPGVVKILTDYIRSGDHQPSTHATFEFNSKQAAAIGQRIESLYDAIAEENVEKLREVVHQLRVDSSNESHMTDAADRLDTAIGTSSSDIDDVLKLAGEVMQICRDSRRTFVHAAESIVTVEE